MSLVLGYGALLDPRHVRELCRAGGGRAESARAGLLLGYRRHWELVYRNGCWDEGCYVDRETWRPFEGGVAFLGVREVAGVAIPVREIEPDEAGLRAIDDEEYLYRRIDVRGRYVRFDGTRPPPGPIWLYVDAPEDYPESRYDGDRIVVTRKYLESVRSASAKLLANGRAHFDATTEPPPWPVADLVWQVREAE